MRPSRVRLVCIKSILKSANENVTNRYAINKPLILQLIVILLYLRYKQ